MFSADDNGEPSLIITASGLETKKNYNPLVGANALIRRAALKVGGNYLLGKDLAGSEYCPICEGVKACEERKNDPKLVIGWITYAADAVAQYAGQLREE